jgi:proteasome component ECM29
MTNIWRVLVSEPRKAVDLHFQTILSELLREMGAKLWRSREAASLALTDLLQGRRWGDVKDRLEEMWRMAFRAIDDIKVS